MTAIIYFWSISQVLRIDQLKRNLRLKTGSTAYPITKGSFLPLLRRSTNEPERQKTYFHRVQGLMQMNFDESDGCVNSLIVANFNLLSLAIRGDTQRFELIERFIKVRNLLRCAF